MSQEAEVLERFEHKMQVSLRSLTQPGTETHPSDLELTLSRNSSFYHIKIKIDNRPEEIFY
ncbi:hypothetical protein HY212_06325 [Candidatus Pacearchaeota archaeon]|nr:hypothetical protein [Candidatus Pacearchaeota archaeon]